MLSFSVMDPFLFFIRTPLGKDEYNMRKGDNDTNRLVIWSIFLGFHGCYFLRMFSAKGGGAYKILTFEAGDSGIQDHSYLMPFSVTRPLKTCNDARFLT